MGKRGKTSAWSQISEPLHSFFLICICFLLLNAGNPAVVEALCQENAHLLLCIMHHMGDFSCTDGISQAFL